MSRKDYTKAVELIRRRYSTTNLDFKPSYDSDGEVAITTFGDFFSDDNPRFDRSRFENACRAHY